MEASPWASATGWYTTWPLDHVDAFGQRVVGQDGRPPAQVGDAQRVGQRRVRQGVGRGVGHGSGHVGHAVEDRPVHREGGVRVRRRPGGLEAAPLVHRDVHQHRSGPHLLDQCVRHQMRGPCSHHQDGPDHDVGLEAHLFDGVLGRRHRLERPAEVVVDLAQAIKVAVEDVHVGMHPDGHGGGGEPGHPGPQNDHAGALHPGHAADEHAPTTTGSHEVMGAHERGHAPGDLAHGGEQGQRVVLRAHRLVGDRHVARSDQGVGALARGGQVEVGEQGLVPAQAEPVILLGDGLLYLADQVGGAPHLVGLLDDLCPRPDEGRVAQGRAVASPLLDQHRVPGGRQLAHTRRGQGDPVLVGLHFGGHSDDHGYSSMLLITCLMRV